MSAEMRLGFAGKAAVHPAQIQPIQRIFSPTPEALAQARRVLQSTSVVLVR
jgi:citrate lyase subunit beta / citryl-CoA lyase